jgi:hypothetical protein
MDTKVKFLIDTDKRHKVFRRSTIQKNQLVNLLINSKGNSSDAKSKQQLEK